MQRIYFSVNTLEVSAHKLRAYGLKTSVHRKIYTLHGKMNELLQLRNEVYFALVLFSVKEITHESHKKHHFQQWKLKIWIRNIVSVIRFVRKLLKYTFIHERENYTSLNAQLFRKKQVVTFDW